MQQRVISSLPSEPDAVFKAKQDLRRTMRTQRTRIDGLLRERAASAAADNLAALVRASGARVVSLYAATRHELSTDPAAGLLRGAGITLAYPRIERTGRRLAFHSVPGPEALSPGTFGISEPAPTMPRVRVEQIDLFVLPGLAFDTRGARLGWGQGYYDRVLADNQRAVRVGFAFEAQLVSYTPCTKRDVPMDHIVSECRTFHCRSYDAWSVVP